MLTGLDHLVILVEELEEAVAGYEELGFWVTFGGEHADGLTHNALVPFADGTYLELVAFVDPDDERDNVWGWRRSSKLGVGSWTTVRRPTTSRRIRGVSWRPGSMWKARTEAGVGSRMVQRSGGKVPAF